MKNSNDEILKTAMQMDMAVKEKMDNMDSDEAMRLIRENTEFIDITDEETKETHKVPVLLLKVENNNIVSTKDISMDEKVKIAIEQYRTLKEQLNNTDFVNDYKKVTDLTIKNQIKSINSSGYRAAIRVGKTNISIIEFNAKAFRCCMITAMSALLACVLCLLGAKQINFYYFAGAVVIVRFATIYSMLTTLSLSVDSIENLK